MAESTVRFEERDIRLEAVRGSRSTSASTDPELQDGGLIGPIPPRSSFLFCLNVQRLLTEHAGWAASERLAETILLEHEKITKPGQVREIDEKPCL